MIQNNMLVWASGETDVPYDNYPGNIQGSPTNECIYIRRDNGRRWDNSSCNFTAPFLCKEGKLYNLNPHTHIAHSYMGKVNTLI